MRITLAEGMHYCTVTTVEPWYWIRNMSRYGIAPNMLKLVVGTSLTVNELK